ncbi:hypothetical protein AB0B45_02750 [Nonomuraea sp. NPDC049152]|uniref:hypothetical protein n=1 Tax=Nonomuraea sp. NPDC049152 TaxID=3154350 RepID=UPI0033D7DEB7
MAWEWVAPIATAVTGIAGTFFTWYSGKQGREHAEQVAKQSAAASLTQLREARRAAAYIEVLTAVGNATAAAIHATMPPGFVDEDDEDDPPFPTIADQVELRAKVDLYGTQEVRRIFAEWRQNLHEVMDSRGEAQVQLPARYERMKDASAQLAEQMNSEMTSERHHLR